MNESWWLWHHPQEGLEGGSRQLQVYQPDFDAMKDYGREYLEYSAGARAGQPG